MAEVFRLDTREFKQAFKQIVATSKRDYAVVVNSRAWHFCWDAVKQTRFADKDRIEAKLGKIGTEIAKKKDGTFRQTKSGKFKRGSAIFAPNSLAARIINSRRDKPIFGDELYKAITKLLAARKKSAGFIRSGWRWGMYTLAKAWRKPERKGRSMSKKEVKGKPKGKATPARDSMFSAATVENSALLVRGKYTKDGNPMPIALDGANRALHIAIKDMKDHLEKKFAAMARKHNGRTV